MDKVHDKSSDGYINKHPNRAVRPGDSIKDSTKDSAKTPAKPSVDMKIGKDFTLHINNGANLETLAAQLQLNTSDLLYVVNGKNIYHHHKDTFPQSLHYEYKREIGTHSRYYFRNTETQDIYCIFGRDMALKIYPKLDEPEFVVPKPKLAEVGFPSALGPQSRSAPKTPKRETRPCIIKLIKHNTISIVDAGVKHTFKDNNYPVECEEKSST